MKKFKKVNFITDAYVKYIYDNVANSLTITSLGTNPLEIPLGGGGGVASLNGLHGDVILASASEGFNFNTVGDTIYLSPVGNWLSAIDDFASQAGYKELNGNLVFTVAGDHTPTSNKPIYLAFDGVNNNLAPYAYLSAFNITYGYVSSFPNNKAFDLANTPTDSSSTKYYGVIAPIKPSWDDLSNKPFNKEAPFGTYNVLTTDGSIDIFNINTQNIIPQVATNGANGGFIIQNISDSGTSKMLCADGDKQIQTECTLNMNSQKIINLGTPTSSTDAATKAYVDAAISSLLVQLGGDK